MVMQHMGPCSPSRPFNNKKLKYQVIYYIILGCIMITEGDEESGSGHMPHYLEKLKERIGKPSYVFCLDSGTIDYDRFWLTTSLRGNLVATLRVETLS